MTVSGNAGPKNVNPSSMPASTSAGAQNVSGGATIVASGPKGGAHTQLSGSTGG